MEIIQKKSVFSWRIFASSSMGTIFEWYDFSLFAFLTPLLATIFFPHQNKFTSLMFTYAIFAIGFFVRPIGAILFGHLGDRIGRKKTLVYSILLMSIPTFIIGLLPTYAQIGIIAPILLTLARLCQGLSVGGESTGAVLFVMESKNFKYRGMVGAMLWAVVGIGILLGSLAGNIVIAHPAYSWAWRVPFLLGLATGLIGYFVRMRTPESVQFEKALENGVLVNYPLWNGLLKHKTKVLRVIGFYTLSSMITYLVFVFMPTYAAGVNGLPLSKITLVSTLGLVAVTFLVPIGGFLSDVLGRAFCLRVSAAAFLVLSYPLFVLISQHSLMNYIQAEIIFVIMAMCYQGSITAAVFDLIPIEVRYSLTAVGYNIANALFGGMAPIAATYIAKVSGNNAAPAFCLMFGAVVAILSTLRLQKIYMTSNTLIVPEI
jgi:MHS family proline/betaine transporter-like MFS transporter